jgi:hypothetical protein
MASSRAPGRAPDLRLDARALERLFQIWNLPLPATGTVLFALRGATPRDPAPAKAGGWTASVALDLTPPDYVHQRCALGQWDRDRGLLFVAPGSTVPHRDNVLKAAARNGTMKGRGTNQLEPGFYEDLTKGEHLQGKPQGHAALRQTGPRFYRRAKVARKNPPLYTNRDPLYFGNPYDNLHCAWNKDPAEPGYRSAGCLVVAGWPHSPRLPDARPAGNRNQGPWKTFHDLLYGAPQQSFPLLLLEAGEAAKALREKAPGKTKARLTYGSQGPEVEKLQARLAARGLYKGRVTGRLGVSTYRAWNKAGLR